jgi:integrase
MPRVKLTNRYVKSLKAPKRRTDYFDIVFPGFGLHATPTGAKSWFLGARYPLRPRSWVQRRLGGYPVLSLATARTKARGWLELIDRGVDPSVEGARLRAENTHRQVVTFAAVAEEFLARHASKLAHAAEARRIVRGEFVARWGARPANDIQPMEAAHALRQIAKRSPAQARNSYGYLSRLYNWAIGSEFGITTNPVVSLRPSDLIGKPVIRNRILSDSELRAVWDACSGRVDAEAPKEMRQRRHPPDRATHLGYPYGPLIRLLILTGQREREVAELRWSEVDLAEGLWVIPAERMKSDRAHLVPLARDALALLSSLPRFSGDFVFTTSDGQKPVNGFSKTKERLDALSGVSEWRIHDLRRTMRTHLSALPIEDRVREQMIGHAQPGLHKVYDLHSYFAEKSRGFELWEDRLRSILIRPSPLHVTNVATVRGAQIDRSPRAPSV